MIGPMMENKGSLKFYRAFGVFFLLLLYGFMALFLFGGARTALTGAKLNNANLEEGGPEEYLNGSFPLRYQFVEGNGFLRRLMGIREMNGITRFDREILDPEFEQIPKEQLEQEAEAMARISDALKERGIPFLYVSPADRARVQDAPAGFVSYENKNTAAYLSLLKERGVPVLDLEELVKEGILRESLYYRSDHHWNEQGALLSAQKITLWLGEATDKETEPSELDIRRFRKLTYPGVMIGSYAQRTGSLFAGGREDFEILLPEFPTDFRELVSGQRGSMEELFYVLEGADRISYQVTTYETVFGKDTARGYVNEQAPNDLSVLFLEDSYGYPLEPFLLTQVKALHIGSSYSPESITPELLGELRPDAVILLKYGPFHLGHEEYFHTAF